ELNINTEFTTQQADDFQYFAEDVRRELLQKIGREELYNGGLYIKTTLNPELQRAANAALKKALDNYNSGRTGDKLQGALVAINPYTGRVLAMSGGYSFADSSFNRATQAYRQVGSTIKPFVYLAALEDGSTWNPTSLILDAPIVGWRENDTMWKPENYDKKFMGPVPLRLALEQSRNVPAVRLVEQIGVEKAISAAQRFGVYPENMNDMNLSLALGSGETTLMKLSLGFAAFINGGYKLDAKLVDYIQDRYGNLISGEKTDNDEEWSNDLTPPTNETQGTPLSDPQSLYQIVSILQGVVERGTGGGANVPGHTIAGKTGTTNDVKDVWFVGFSKNMVVGVWMGYDTPKPMGRGTGSGMPARVFADFMKTALSGDKNQPFSVPDGLEFRRVNRNTGATAVAGEPSINEVFKQGQKPNAAQNKKTITDTKTNDIEIGGIF
ncbi:MAG: hypothetical protein LBL75_03330, partial [Rickettsiales bacterium]|nr:hypothetical protein [Rickettsiales bacterium]